MNLGGTQFNTNTNHDFVASVTVALALDSSLPKIFNASC